MPEYELGCKAKPSTRVSSFQHKILVQRIWSCVGITLCEQSSEAVSLLLNRRLNFTAPAYSPLPRPRHRTSCSQKHGEKKGRLVGFAAQQFPYTCKVGRSSLVRGRGGTGLVHPPGMTQDSSSEPSAAQSARSKTDNVQVLPPSPPTGPGLLSAPHPCHHQLCFSARTKAQAWMDTPGTHVFLDTGLRISSS